MAIKLKGVASTRPPRGVTALGSAGSSGPATRTLPAHHFVGRASLIFFVGLPDVIIITTSRRRQRRAIQNVKPFRKFGIIIDGDFGIPTKFLTTLSRSRSMFSF